MRQKNVMERRVRLKMINQHITCVLCKGYLIDATTITECLHTFCKTCIVKYLEENNTCPTCGQLIHQSHPLNYISHDRTMQELVYKLVPSLLESERKMVVKFYRRRGLPLPKEMAGRDKFPTTTEEMSKEEDADHHRSDEQVNVCLECNHTQLKTLKRKFIRCSSQATVTHLRKFLALKLFNNVDRFKDVDLLCNDEILGKDHTLKFVCVTRWRYKDIPLKLNFRPKMEFT